MENFRQLEAVDPFGQHWKVEFKWLLTAISLRHSDTVDVKFVMRNDGERVEKTIAIAHPDLLALGRRKGRPLTDPWCSRLAALHLRHLIETGEDLEKDLITIPPDRLERWAEALAS